MKIVFYGEVTGSHVPPTQQPINQQSQHSPGKQAILECPVLDLPQSFICSSAPPSGQRQMRGAPLFEEVSSELAFINWSYDKVLK